MTRASADSLLDKAFTEEVLSDGVRYAREFMQRWENRLTLKNPAFTKRYIEGDLVLVVRIQSRTGESSSEYLAVFNELPRVRCGRYPNVKAEASGVPVRPNEAELRQSGCDGDDSGHLMFIYHTGFLEEPKVLVPRLVRFELAKDVERSLHRGLFYSATAGFKFLGTVRKGEVGLPLSPTLTGSRVHELVPKNIKSRAEVVDSISSDSSPDQRNFSCVRETSEPQDTAPGIRIILSDEVIRCWIKEPFATFFKVSDVIFGPFGLNPSAGYPFGHEELEP